MSRHQEGPEPVEEQAAPGERRAEAGSRLSRAARRRVQLERARTTYPPLRRLLDFVLAEPEEGT